MGHLPAAPGSLRLVAKRRPVRVKADKEHVVRHPLIAIVAGMFVTAAVQTVFGTGQHHPMAGAAATPPAQQVPAHVTPAPPPAPPPLPPPTIGPVGPPMLFPFTPLMSPPAGGLTPPAGQTDPRFAPRTQNRAHAPRSSQFGSPFYGPFVSGYSSVEDAAIAAPSAPAGVPTGLLRLSVTPASAQVFIDSYFVGTVADLEAQRALTLPAGPHRIEIRAPYYQPLIVDVRIAPYEIVTYRAALERARPEPPAAPGPSTSSGPMYLIPNCYVGNVPPRASRLPAGCDVNKVQVLGSK